MRIRWRQDVTLTIYESADDTTAPYTEVVKAGHTEKVYISDETSTLVKKMCSGNGMFIECMEFTSGHCSFNVLCSWFEVI